ncbi:hypothetical protein FisN_5Hh166 [Fistulifera solaris]|uniref:ABC transporter domain-containing protein n=1 Tax=Fistulifera solaris TaxID=1519565 RepID=A0A1Z5JRY8_FISSO|nr:hypothetical protein FisN_5Hh166 [Fistulifera solaris]|eukprot:GAX16795.1 hypothetical protein FisN_5Hh166 [Fistulifera solaris]
MPAASVLQSQLESLNDTDTYATAWQQALCKSALHDGKISWSGRGQGGRGISRRTFQSKDILVDGVRLEYVSNSNQGSGRILLEDAVLKLLAAQVYVLIGRNASGKSTLLKRVQAGLIPGFPPHISTLFLPQEIQSLEIEDAAQKTTIEILKHYSQRSISSTEKEITLLEAEMEKLDMSSEEDQAAVEEIADKMARLEDNMKKAEVEFEKNMKEALSFVGLHDATLWTLPLSALSPGLRKRAILAIPLVCQSNLLLLDEPTNGLDIQGLLMLRDLIELVSTRNQTTTLMVSHDHDLMDDVADYIIDFFEKNLLYYPGNYSSYRIYRRQNDLHAIRQLITLEKKRDHMLKTLENVKKQAKPKRSKNNKAAVVRRKIEKAGIDKDEHGHHRTNQSAGSGIKTGSINALDASTRRALSTTQLLDMTKKSIAPPPDKAVQFIFKHVTSRWNEPLIVATDVGHAYDNPSMPIVPPKRDEANAPANTFIATKRDGMIFDCVDFCAEEGQRYCILGESGSGKSTLLRLLAKLEKPSEGSVKHALNVDVAFLDQEHVDSVINPLTSEEHNCISFLAKRFPTLNEQDIRGSLTSFGLGPQQATTNVKYLSGGERCRLFLSGAFLESPQLLFLDEPTANFDVESVEALCHGLNHWNGTVVMVSHDTSFIRAVNAKCYALIGDEGKLRRVDGGIDEYLRSFA